MNILNRSLSSEVTWLSADICASLKSGSTAAPGGARNAAAEQLRREPAASPALAVRAGQVMGR